MSGIYQRRDVEQYFIDEMNKGLDWGRRQGRVGWDSEWKETAFEDGDLIDNLRAKLEEELKELDSALVGGDSFLGVLREAADLSNVAMMIADAVRVEELKQGEA